MQNLGDGGFEAFMCVGDNKLYAAQTTPGQTAQKLGPECLGLGCADRHAQHFASAIGVDTRGDGDRHADNAAGLTHLQISGI